MTLRQRIPMASNIHERLEYADVSPSYRAPRAALLVRGEDNWIYWARLAIYAGCGIWGGHGFVLVPHKGDGVVDPAILRAIRAYDPDYVVSLPITLGQYDAVYPGTIDAHVKKLEADGYDAEAIESMRSQMPSLPLHPEEDEKARKSVVAACSTYRMALGEDADTSKWDERVTSLRPSDSGPFT